MKRLIYFAPVLLIVGCAPEQVGQAFDFAQMGADASGAAAAVPSPLSPYLGIASLAGNAIIGIAAAIFKSKHNSEKVQNNAHFQGVKNVADRVEALASDLKSGNVDTSNIADSLSGLVKATMEEAHSAYGVYEQVEKRLADMKKKGEISKING